MTYQLPVSLKTKIKSHKLCSHSHVSSLRTDRDIVMRVDDLDATIQMHLCHDENYTKIYDVSQDIELGKQASSWGVTGQTRRE